MFKISTSDFTDCWYLKTIANYARNIQVTGFSVCVDQVSRKLWTHLLNFRATFLLRELKASFASKRRIPRVWGSSRIFRREWMATSTPPLIPAQNWIGPVDSFSSGFNNMVMAWLYQLYVVSPFPLLRVLHQGFYRGELVCLQCNIWFFQELMYSVHSLRANKAIASQSSPGLDLNCLEHSILIQPSKSNPVGPADPWFLLAAA